MRDRKKRLWGDSLEPEKAQPCRHLNWRIRGQDTYGDGFCLDCGQTVDIGTLTSNMLREMEALWEKGKHRPPAQQMALPESVYKALLSSALRAICLTRDYVGEETLPALEGWDWYDAGRKLAGAVPDDEWALQFWARVNAGVHQP